MALAIDSSTPAIKSQGVSSSAINSNTFSPPAGSLVVAVVENGFGSLMPTGVTSSAGSLSFSKVFSGSTGTAGSGSSVSVWIADCPSALTNITANTSAMSGNSELAISVLVFTGAAAAASQTGSSATVSSPVAGSTHGAALASAASTSWVLGGMADFNNDDDPPTLGTSQIDSSFGSSTTSQHTGSSGSGTAWWVQGNSAVGNSNLRMYWTAPTGTSTSSTLLAFEIKSGSTSTNATVNAAAGQLRLWSPAPGVSLGASVTAGTGQVRFWSPSPPSVSLGASVTATPGQLRFWSPSRPSVSGTATVSARPGQIRFWSRAPSVTTNANANVTTASGQIRFWSHPPSILTGTVVNAAAGQIRMWSRQGGGSVALTISAPTPAQVRFWSPPPAVVAISNATIHAAAGQIRWWSALSGGTSIGITPIPGQIRIRAGTFSVSGTTGVAGPDICLPTAAFMRSYTSAVAIASTNTAASMLDSDTASLLASTDTNAAIPADDASAAYLHAYDTVAALPGSDTSADFGEC